MINGIKIYYHRLNFKKNKVKYKVICLEDCDSYYFFKKGEIFEYTGIKYCMSIYDGAPDVPCMTLESEGLEYWVGETTFNNNFMSLSEYREKQIKSVIDES
jgi:hypothetical protein